ncbi:hypothetical protein SNE40_014656 [Patella caerulea]|uniref:RWD domain-containing protein n=1 Tax=Patella caerulea TaxID=87958 RepID=A0AAN8JE10_PATCE
MAGKQEEEVASLKVEFAGRCRIVELGENGSGFIRSITLQPKNMDLTIKFQLKDTYPTTIPKISIRSSSLEENDINGLVEALDNKAKSCIKEPMITELMTLAETWLNEQGVGKGTKPKTNNHKHQKKNRKKKIKENSDDIDTKQASMKTSADVIKRIQWDSDLPQEEFLVGYMDRFIGIQEKYFSAFSWEDIASVDYNVLAIPKHRIEYFKYKDLKVWDKPTRLDNVFGSLGSGKTIKNIIDNYEEEYETWLKNHPKDESEEKTNEDKKKDCNGDDNSTDEDDSDDDGIVVSLDSASINTESRCLYLDHLKRPTHFIALRIIDAEAVQKMTEVQTLITDQKPQLKAGCMPAACFHITLCTLGLDRAEQILKACDVLKNNQSELCKLKPSESLKIIGVDNFYNRTVFAKIKYPRMFLDFVDHLKQCFRNAGIEIRDNYGFVPHATILKISKQEARQLGSKFLVSNLYHNYKEGNLGSQYMNSICLCAMGDQRQEDGFWVSQHDLKLDS